MSGDDYTAALALIDAARAVLEQSLPSRDGDNDA
jgi:hypothetical protein